MTRARVACVVILLFVLPSCGVSELNFKEDERVTITAPGDRAEVQLPLTVTWTVRDFDGTFGVYVDRAPQPPGKPQSWFAREDDQCASTPECPDEAYLAQRNVFATTDTSFLIERLPRPSSNAPKRREFHEVTIVLLDSEGERIGESAFVREFEVDR